MSLRVSGKNIQIGEALQDHVRSRTSAAVGRYYDGAINGHVTVEPDGSAYRCDVTLHLDAGLTLHAEGRAHDPYASFDQANHRIETRLRRHKKRLKARHAAPSGLPDATISTYTIEAADEDEQEVETHPLVVAETKAPFRTLTVAAAVAELDLSGIPVLVFRHAVNEQVNIVYRRPDGHVGWIDSSTISNA